MIKICSHSTIGVMASKYAVDLYPRKMCYMFLLQANHLIAVAKQLRAAVFKFTNELVCSCCIVY